MDDIIFRECTESGCDGYLDENVFLISTKNKNQSETNPCKKCGRLYWKKNGNPVFNQAKMPAFLINGALVVKTKNGTIIKS